MTTIIQLNDRYLTDFIEGRKKSTIRRGRREYPFGECILQSSSRGVSAIIENIRYCRLEDLTDDDAIIDGFKSKNALLQTLFTFYTDLKPDDEMSIVYFAPT